MEEAIGMRTRFCLSFQTNLNQAQYVLVDRCQRLVQQPLHGGGMQTRRLCLIRHLPPVDGRGGEPGGPDKYNSDILEPTTLEDPGARTASPRAALP
jgi:hypothetical protein